MKHNLLICTFSFLVTIAFFNTACNTSHLNTDEYRQYKTIYIRQFKLNYLRSYLLKSYNYSPEIWSIILSDHSGFTEPLLAEADMKLIDSLTKADNIKLVADSANTIGRVAEGAEGKHPLGYLLEKFESKWLDSLAKKQYRSREAKQQFRNWF